jgi:hypothetical protein
MARAMTEPDERAERHRLIPREKEDDQIETERRNCVTEDLFI